MDRKPVVNAHEVEGFRTGGPDGADFGATVAPLGPLMGLERLGCMVTTVEPGMRAFPFHAHHGNDEMFVVLEGTGEVRIGEATHPIGAGDVIGCPAGGAETAHQIRNTGDGALRYLAISSMFDPDVVEYPDSGKFGALSIGAGRTFETARLNFIGKADDGRDYWEGET